MAIDPNNLAGTAHLTFDDEFNTLSLWNGTAGTWDTTAAWEAVDSNGYTLANNGEQEWYINSTYGPTSSVTPWTVSNGVMSLTGAPASASIQPLINNYQYTSGQLSTAKSFSQEYGYFEVNAKLPSGQGFWPAFWLMPENGSWPPELDVMENLGNNTSTYYTTVHYNANNQYQSSAINTGVDLSAGFHTYGVDWEADYITWYFDGKEVYQVATPSDMNTPMYMILNLALGGNWPGDMNSSTQLPGSMQVDWVRAYSAGPGSSTGSTGSTTGGTGTTGSGSAGTTSTGSASGGTTTTDPTVLTAPNDSGTTLTAGSGDYTLVASHGPDILVAGSGPDTFEFPVIPWSAGQIQGFDPSQDKLDFTALFQAAHYAGTDPVGDGWLSFVADGKGDTEVFFNPHDGSNGGNAYLITTIDGVVPSSINVSQDVVFSATSTSTSGSSGGATTTSGGTAASDPTVLTAPNDSGTTLTAGSGNYTLVASHGPDTLVAGSGADVFEFPVLPWSAGQIQGFNPSLDKLDLSGLFQAAHYTGTDPVADGWLSFGSDGKGDTEVFFNPHDGSNGGYAYLITTIDGVAPSSINEAQNVIFSTSTSTLAAGSTATTATTAPTILTAPNDNGTTLTAGSGAYTLIASHGADVLVAGSGPDTFEFPVIPWAAGHIQGFDPSQDVLDLAPLFKTAGYTGSNPVSDGWLSFGSDGKGDTEVFFNPHNGTNNGYPYLITTLDHIAPSSMVQGQGHDWIFS